jgi:hypothetical protein
MTIRSHISRKKRKIFIVTYSGLLFFILGIILSTTLGIMPLVPFIGFAVFFVSIACAFWGIRCPHCKGNFGYIAMYHGSPFSVSKKVKYCPFCGIDIDTELETPNQV